MTSGRDAPFDACEFCEEPFESGVWYPAATVRDADGRRRLVSFCDRACQTNWRDAVAPDQPIIEPRPH